jgi:hypothetical protein
VTDENEAQSTTPSPVAMHTVYSWGAVKLALDVMAWTAVADRSGMESPNYALEAASPAALVQVAELLAFRVGLAAAGVRSPAGGGVERQTCSEALTWVQDEIIRRLTPPVASDPF